MVNKGKFDIEIESDKGKEDILSFINNHNFNFKLEDEERIIERLRFIARKNNFKNFEELLSLFKKDKGVVDDTLEFLNKGVIYNQKTGDFSPLIKRKKSIQDYVDDKREPKKKKKKKRRRRIINSPQQSVIFNNPTDTENINRILRIMEKHNINHEVYKTSYLMRRLHHRMRRLNIDRYYDYARYLETDLNESSHLHKSLSINVTRFFRNKDMYEILRDSVLSEVFEFKGSIKIWSAGCAVGCEPYSVAMLIDRHFNEKDKRRVSITASDISYEFIDKAREGLFGKDLLKETDKLYLLKYFQLRGEKYRISPTLSRYIHFRTHDLQVKPPIINLNLILCRNVLIYFSKEQSKELFVNLANVLKPGGFLILGKSEIMRGAVRDEFEVYDANTRIYRKIV